MEVGAFEAPTTWVMNLGVERFMVYNNQVIREGIRRMANPVELRLRSGSRKK